MLREDVQEYSNTGYATEPWLRGSLEKHCVYDREDP